MVPYKMEETKEESVISSEMEELKRFQPAPIRGDQRVTFIGQTGSGKSVVARYFLKLARAKGWRIVIIDPKKDWMKYLGQKMPFAKDGLGTVDSPWLVGEFYDKFAVQIFQPLEWNDDCKFFFQDIIKTGNTIVYTDEITQLATANNVPKELKVIWTQGRALNIGAWCATQRPLGIPEIIKSQSEVWFLFRVNSKDDREVVKGYIPLDGTPEVIDKPLPKYEFWYWDDTLEHPIHVAPLKLEEISHVSQTRTLKESDSSQYQSRDTSRKAS